jgi:hypothetical protein
VELHVVRRIVIGLAEAFNAAIESVLLIEECLGDGG